jgi:hypothetical protein
VIITRADDRRLRLTATDVKNGDRWTMLLRELSDPAARLSGRCQAVART